MNQYDPEKHNRRSIRMKEHDYAGGGLYFVTICAHRKAGNIFAPESVREMVARVWANMPNIHVGASLVGALSSEKGPYEGHPYTKGPHEGYPYTIMPDHFHGIIRVKKGDTSLGEVIGAFKSLVVNEYIAGVKAGKFAPFPGKIWHRNYYEMIVRTPEAAQKISDYICRNPWKNVVHFGSGLRGIGNPGLWLAPKVGMLCSRSCPAEVLERTRTRLAEYKGCCLMSGFHSPSEKAILSEALNTAVEIICCPSWGIDTMKIPPEWLPALEKNRMLILEMDNQDGDRFAAQDRNRFVLEKADRTWLPYIRSGGMLDRLVREFAGKDSEVEMVKK